jgi:acyl-CoA thioester hydrolase
LSGYSFRLPEPHVITHRVTADEIDAYRHVNNAVYVRWLDRAAWEHSARLGVSIEHCIDLRRGMAVRHTRLDYVAAAVLDEELLVATWIYESDGRLRCSRRFEVRRGNDDGLVLEAEVDYFCLNLDTGRPARFPPEFATAYEPSPLVAQAYAALPEAHRHLGRWTR